MQDKKKNTYLNNVDAIEAFIGSETYAHVSSGKYHDEWFEKLKKNKFIDPKTKKKIPDETVRLLQVQKDAVIKQ